LRDTRYYALINTNPVYQLDGTPPVGSFNLVIVYLPFDLYADPTVALSFVGRLPRADRSKPVLRAARHQVRRRRSALRRTTSRASQAG